MDNIGEQHQFAQASASASSSIVGPLHESASNDDIAGADSHTTSMQEIAALVTPPHNSRALSIPAQTEIDRVRRPRPGAPLSPSSPSGAGVGIVANSLVIDSAGGSNSAGMSSAFASYAIENNLSQEDQTAHFLEITRDLETLMQEEYQLESEYDRLEEELLENNPHATMPPRLPVVDELALLTAVDGDENRCMDVLQDLLGNRRGEIMERLLHAARRRDCASFALEAEDFKLLIRNFHFNGLRLVAIQACNFARQLISLGLAHDVRTNSAPEVDARASNQLPSNNFSILLHQPNNQGQNPQQIQPLQIQHAQPISINSYAHGGAFSPAPSTISSVFSFYSDTTRSLNRYQPSPNPAYQSRGGQDTANQAYQGASLYDSTNTNVKTSLFPSDLPTLSVLHDESKIQPFGNTNSELTPSSTDTNLSVVDVPRKVKRRRPKVMPYLPLPTSCSFDACYFKYRVNYDELYDNKAIFDIRAHDTSHSNLSSLKHSAQASSSSQCSEASGSDSPGAEPLYHASHHLSSLKIEEQAHGIDSLDPYSSEAQPKGSYTTLTHIRPAPYHFPGSRSKPLFIREVPPRCLAPLHEAVRTAHTKAASAAQAEVYVYNLEVAMSARSESLQAPSLSQQDIELLTRAKDVAKKATREVVRASQEVERRAKVSPQPVLGPSDLMYWVHEFNFEFERLELWVALRQYIARTCEAVGPVSDNFPVEYLLQQMKRLQVEWTSMPNFPSQSLFLDFHSSPDAAIRSDSLPDGAHGPSLRQQPSDEFNNGFLQHPKQDGPIAYVEAGQEQKAPIISSSTVPGKEWLNFEMPPNVEPGNFSVDNLKPENAQSPSISGSLFDEVPALLDKLPNNSKQLAAVSSPTETLFSPVNVEEQQARDLTEPALERVPRECIESQSNYKSRRMSQSLSYTPYVASMLDYDDGHEVNKDVLQLDLEDGDNHSIQSTESSIDRTVSLPPLKSKSSRESTIHEPVQSSPSHFEAASLKSASSATSSTSSSPPLSLFELRPAPTLFVSPTDLSRIEEELQTSSSNLLNLLYGL